MKTNISVSGLPKDLSTKGINFEVWSHCTKRIACVFKVVTRTYPLSCCYITFASDISRDQKHLLKMAKNASKRPHVQGVLDNFFPKRAKGESLIHYKLSFQHSELALADINKVCVLHVKRVIEPQRPLNTSSSLVIMRTLRLKNFETCWIVWLVQIPNSYNRMVN